MVQEYHGPTKASTNTTMNKNGSIPIGSIAANANKKSMSGAAEALLLSQTQPSLTKRAMMQNGNQSNMTESVPNREINLNLDRIGRNCENHNNLSDSSLTDYSHNNNNGNVNLFSYNRDNTITTTRNSKNNNTINFNTFTCCFCRFNSFDSFC